jgi:hypothetical protein
MALPFALLVAITTDVTASEFSGQMFTVQQVLSATTFFRDCTFLACAPGSVPAGAIYLDKTEVSLGIAGCAFVECHSALDGGAICAEACCSFSLATTSGGNCSATREGSFCAVVITSPATGSIEVGESSIVLCAASQYTTLSFRCWSGYSSGNTTLIESLNSTANYAHDYGSGLYSDEHFDLCVHFSIFSGNGDADCLYFEEVIVLGHIDCVSLINNSCLAGTKHPCLIYLCRATTIFGGCIFQANRFVYFLQAFYHVWSPADVIVCVDCVFDLQTLDLTGGVSVVITNCTFEIGPTSLAQCVTRTPYPSRTATPIQSRSPTPRKALTARATDTPSQTEENGFEPDQKAGKLSAGAIAGIVIGSIIGVVLIAAAGLLLYRFMCRNEEWGRVALPYDMYDDGGMFASCERQEAMELVRDRQRS